MLHTYVCCLGSNHEAPENLSKACEALERCFPGIRFTSQVTTAPIGMRVNQACFLNRLGSFTSPLIQREVVDLFKLVERMAGRVSQDKEKEIVKLDIDLLACNGSVCKPTDWERPYVQTLLHELDLPHSFQTTQRFVGIIPARYNSTRFPGKPLALLGGKPVIQHVWERVIDCLDELYVATDDERIATAVHGFGGKAVMTSKEHLSGTERCEEALRLIDSKADVVINIQGDEPFISPTQIEQVKLCFENSETSIATLAIPQTAAELTDNFSCTKVVFGADGRALYFSRAMIPYHRSLTGGVEEKHPQVYKHLGLYGFRREVLQALVGLPPSVLEQAESLEQLRWLENGYRVRVEINELNTIAIDIPQDLQRAETYLKYIEKK